MSAGPIEEAEYPPVAIPNGDADEKEDPHVP
jgi:hypothetical protein